MAGLLLALAGCSDDGKTGGLPPIPSDRAPGRWDLTAIYRDEAAFEADIEQLRKAQAAFSAQCPGHLGKASGLADCLGRYSDLQERAARLSGYAQLRYDEDTTNAVALARKQQTEALQAGVAEATSFLEPELVALGPERIDKLMRRHKALAGEYRHLLKETMRRAPHTLSAPEERLMAMAGPMAETAAQLQTTLTNAEMPWPTVTLQGGQTLRLDQTGYQQGRQLPDRSDRQAVFEAFWKTFSGYEQTLGVALYGQLQRDRFLARARRYDSTRAASLDRDGVPLEVYDTLIREAERGLPTLQRYLRLRARLMGLDRLAAYDLYAPVTAAAPQFTLGEAEQAVLNAVAPLGADYQRAMAEGFNDGWMDSEPRPGKRSGAYMMGSIHAVHPFVLMQFTGDFDAVSTLAHEWGHAMHSHLANRKQNFLNAQYPIFLAEVASTVNERLLIEDAIGKAKSDEERLFYLNEALESLRGTFFRQAMFAAFERDIHDRLAAGEALTGADFSRLYLALVRRYLGQDTGVVDIADAYGIEWAYIPHFYYNFYVYQYATSIAAASLLTDNIARGGEQRTAYMNLLAAGGSDNPYRLLKQVGVDLATPAPYRSLIQRMDRLLNEMETIVARRGL
ncbi:MAG TPA: oligoendopeptidase F [Candidatus Macondimonas sp.]|nr:oligoendopeptidase F [Candidatus Macondimonas sp.]